MWADGHYPTIAAHLQPAAARLVEAAGVGPGDRVLDVVLSGFAHIFAPRHEVVAAELARVCRRGGTVACAVWAHDTDDDAFGAIEVIARYLGVQDEPSSALDQEYLVAVGHRT